MSMSNDDLVSQANETISLVEQLIFNDEKFIDDATAWWNSPEDLRMKAFIVGMAYYETLAHNAEHPERLLDNE